MSARFLAVALASAALAVTGCATPQRGPMDEVRDAAASGDIERTFALAAATPRVKTFYGVDVAALDLALYVAARNGNLGMMKALIDKGANPLVPDVLDIAASSDQAGAAAYLLSLGADPASTTGWGGEPTTPYQSARKHARARVVALFNDSMVRGPASARAPVEVRAPAASPVPAPASVVVVSDVDAPKSRGASRPDDFALLIGIEGYQSLPKADYGERDAQTVRKHLEALGFPPRNIVSLTGPQATGNKLKSYLEEWLPLNVKPESTLFVYYSGHGAPDPKTGEAYLVPWDGDPSFLKSTAYPLKKLYADLGKIKARRVFVALDACFSGAGGRSVLAQGARPLVAKVADAAPSSGAITVLAAASGDEITGSLPEQGHGMFTYFLLKGLAEGKRSAAELHGYLSPKVQDEARRQNRTQTPVRLGEGSL
jgi:hypothetical protein